MDPVQELLQGMGEAPMESNARAAPTPFSSPSSHTTTRRTKMVFVYSDEDEDDNNVTVEARLGTAGVPCDDHAISLSEDALAELRAQAHASNSDNEDENRDGDEPPNVGNGLFFREDLLGGLGAAATAAGLSSSAANSLTDRLSSGVRVREVDAPALWEGAFGSNSSPQSPEHLQAHDADGMPEMPVLLRRGLPAATFVLESRRKRFRDTEREERAEAEMEAEARRQNGQCSVSSAAVAAPAAALAEIATSQTAAAAAEASPAEVSEDDGEEVVEEMEVLPVYEADGQTVRALQTRGGYQLTLDERDLLENPEEEVEKGEAEEMPYDAANDGEADEVHPPSNGEGGNEEMEEDGEADGAKAEESGAGVDGVADTVMEDDDAYADFFDDEDDEDEEEEELDEALVVAVAEQLVRCCKADDLDPQMSIEATRFVATAKPLLAQLTSEEITPKEFGQRIDRDLRRFQRIYRSVYRPRDAPIVIDGVTMDM